MDKPSQQGLEKELARRQAFDDAHRPATAGARPRVSGSLDDGRVGRGGRRSNGQGLATPGQVGGAAPRREDAEIANPDKTLRQDVQQKTPEEFLRVEGERADLIAVAIILPAKRHRVVRDGDEPVIGDRDAVRVPREIVQHVGGTAKRRLRVDHPVLAIQRSQKRAKGDRRGEGLERTGKRQPALSKRLAQTGHQFPAKDLSEDLHR